MDGTRKPLKSWFYAIWHATDPDRKLTAVALGEALELKSYRTAWAWMHKIRELMKAAKVNPGKRKIDRGLAFCRVLRQAAE